MVFRWTDNRHGGGARVYAEAGEHTLVKGLRQGDPDAFAALFSLYRSRIFNYVARIVGNREDAKDVTQEVFVKAFRQIPPEGAGLALKPWLYRVATTTCLDHLRARHRRGEPSSIASEDLPDLGDAFEKGETSGLVQQTLDRLSDRHRLVLLLKDVHGLHHDEIATIMGISRGATETLLFRARAAFRRAFLDPGGEAPARAGCPQRRRAALAFMVGETSLGERRRVLDHARTCRDCRKVVRRTRNAGFGLTVLMPVLALPHALQGASLAGSGAAAAGLGASLSASAGGGLLAKIGGAATAKIAIVAAATVTVAGTGVAVEQSRKSTRHAGPQTVAAARAESRSDRRAASPAPQGWSVQPAPTAALRAMGERRREGGPAEARRDDTIVASVAGRDTGPAPGNTTSAGENGGSSQASADDPSSSRLGQAADDANGGGQTGSPQRTRGNHSAGKHRHPVPTSRKKSQAIPVVGRHK